jgi:hypothetical protein
VIPTRLPWEAPPLAHTPLNGNAPAGFAWHEFRSVDGDYGRTALEREAAMVRGTLPGGRNHALNRAAFSVGQLVADGRLDRGEAYQTLYDAGVAAGLSEAEVRATLASGLRGGAAKPRAPITTSLILPASYTPARGQVETGPEPEPDEDEAVRQHLPRLDWEAVFSAEDDTDWIVEPLIPARRLVALYSAPKVGKSLLMLEIAVQVSRGGDVLGVSTGAPRRVLYVDFENDPRGDIRERLRAMGFGPKDLGGLDYLSFPRLAALDTANGGAQLAAAVRVYGSQVVIVDTISRAIAGEENENDTWLNFYRHTGRLMKAEGVALVRLDHSGKDESRGQRGGSAKSGDVDMVWRMSKVADGVYQLECEASRLPVLEKTIVVHRESAPRLNHRVDAQGRYAAFRAQVDELQVAADIAGLDRAIGRERMRQWMKDNGRRASNSVVEEVCRRRKGHGGIDDDER